ncbi:MAG: transcription antitermination factor NusB [Candidatus Hydrogenedentes bacterium]|nr:transcription antitermination factor NusB [Candidatus Hydrogenedentota bacterium]
MLSPQVRRNARERAIQFLFGLEFTRYEWDSVVDAFWEESPSRPGVRQYAMTLIRGVVHNLAGLDADIEATVKNWTPTRVGQLERNILRVAIFEMRHGADVPAKVAINEAIEIAKRYGSDDAPRFINGVLDRVREEMSRQTVT